MQKQSDTMTIKSVHKAISILNCFSPDKPVLGVGEISELVVLSKSTASRLLATLESRGCVEKAGGHGRYRLGYRVYLWGTISEKHANLATVATPIMERLRDDCKEEVSLYVVEGFKRVCVRRVGSPHEIARVVAVGEYLPLHAGAAGRVLLAYLPEEHIRKILSGLPRKKLTPRTITDPGELEQSLCTIRNNGYGISRGEREPGAYSVVAPVWDASNQVVASLAISGPEFRLSDEQLELNIKGILCASQAISKKLGRR